MNYKITGTGSCIPETIKKNSEFLSNYFFDIDGNQIQSSNIDIVKKLESITGINERKYVSDKINSSDLALSSSGNSSPCLELPRKTSAFRLCRDHISGLQDRPE